MMPIGATMSIVRPNVTTVPLSTSTESLRFSIAVCSMTARQSSSLSIASSAGPAKLENAFPMPAEIPSISLGRNRPRFQELPNLPPTAEPTPLNAAPNAPASRPSWSRGLPLTAFIAALASTPRAAPAPALINVSVSNMPPVAAVAARPIPALAPAATAAIAVTTGLISRPLIACATSLATPPSRAAAAIIRMHPMMKHIPVGSARVTGLLPAYAYAF